MPSILTNNVDSDIELTTGSALSLSTANENQLQGRYNKHNPDITNQIHKHYFGQLQKNTEDCLEFTDIFNSIVDSALVKQLKVPLEIVGFVTYLSTGTTAVCDFNENHDICILNNNEDVDYFIIHFHDESVEYLMDEIADRIWLYRSKAPKCAQQLERLRAAIVPDNANDNEDEDEDYRIVDGLRSNLISKISKCAGGDMTICKACFNNFEYKFNENYVKCENNECDSYGLYLIGDDVLIDVYCSKINKYKKCCIECVYLARSCGDNGYCEYSGGLRCNCNTCRQNMPLIMCSYCDKEFCANTCVKNRCKGGCDNHYSCDSCWNEMGWWPPVRGYRRPQCGRKRIKINQRRWFCQNCACCKRCCTCHKTNTQ